MELLNDIALFVEVVKAMSFRKASDATGIPNSTLSRRVSGLEKEIGLRLLNRTTRKIELTEAGRIYFERCKRIVDEARIAHEQLGELLAQPSGVLRVSLPVDFATVYLAPLMAEFCDLYPKINFELDLTPRQVDLVAESVDVVVRMGEPKDSNLIARQIARLPRYLYASTGYLERYGEPTHPSELEHHECLRMRTDKSAVWKLHRVTETVEVKVHGRFSLNSVGMIRRLATFDRGIAILESEIVAEDVANNKLRQILPEWQASSVPVYAITETRLLPVKTQRFIEFLNSRLGNTQPQIFI